MNVIKTAGVFLIFFLAILSLTGCTATHSSESRTNISEAVQQPLADSTDELEGSDKSEPVSNSETPEDKDISFDFETKTVHLNSGYDMPIAGLGTYALSDEECFNSITVLLKNGGRLIDTAYFYGNEASVGRAVRESDVPREEIFVTTKLYPNQFSGAEAAIDEALEKMDIEYIDMMMLHHPGTNDVKAYQQSSKLFEMVKSVP